MADERFAAVRKGAFGEGFDELLTERETLEQLLVEAYRDRQEAEAAIEPARQADLDTRMASIDKRSTERPTPHAERDARERVEDCIGQIQAAEGRLAINENNISSYREVERANVLGQLIPERRTPKRQRILKLIGELDKELDDEALEEAYAGWFAETGRVYAVRAQSFRLPGKTQPIPINQILKLTADHVLEGSEDSRWTQAAFKHGIVCDRTEVIHGRAMGVAPPTQTPRRNSTPGARSITNIGRYGLARIRFTRGSFVADLPVALETLKEQTAEEILDGVGPLVDAAFEKKVTVIEPTDPAAASIMQAIRDGVDEVRPSRGRMEVTDLAQARRDREQADAEPVASS